MTSTQEQAQEVAAQAKDKAGEAAQQARGRAREQVDQRTTQAGQQVATQASDVRSVAEALREKGQDKPAELADRAADQAEKLGSYLQDANADRLLHDLEDLGRRQPMAVAFGGLALGFAASRFLKASSAQRYATTSTSGAPRPYTPPVAPAIPPTTTGVGAGTGIGAGIGTPPPAPATGTTFPDPIGTEPVIPTPHTAGGL